MLLHAPGFGFGVEQDFGAGPYAFEELRSSVAFKFVLVFPDAVCEKNVGLIHIVQQLKMTAAFKVPDQLLGGIEDLKEFVHFFGSKAHFYNADDHKNLMVIESFIFKFSRLPALPFRMAISK